MKLMKIFIWVEPVSHYGDYYYYRTIPYQYHSAAVVVSGIIVPILSLVYLILFSIACSRLWSKALELAATEPRDFSGAVMYAAPQQNGVQANGTVVYVVPGQQGLNVPVPLPGQNLHLLHGGMVQPMTMPAPQYPMPVPNFPATTTAESPYAMPPPQYSSSSAMNLSGMEKKMSHH
jgi:hypothetical protein